MMSILIAALAVVGVGDVGSSDLDVAVRRYDAAQVSADKGELEAMLADDYVLVNSSGGTEDKRQFIADQLEPGYKLEPFTVLHAIERRWRDGAVMGGVARLKGASGGKPFEVCLRFVDVWRRSAGHWQVAFTQAARAKAEECSVTAT